MSKIDFYSHLASPPCRAVQIFMKKNGIPFQYHHVDLPKGEHKTENYLKINPIGKIPAIKDGDFCVLDSMAIVQYLADKFSTPDHWYPEDIAIRAKINEYLCWHHTNTREGAGYLFFEVVMIPKIRHLPRNEETIKSEKMKLSASLDMMENYFLNGYPFISSNEISIADLFALCELSQIERLGIDIGKKRANVKAWRERVIAKLGSHYNEAHETIVGFARHFNVTTEPFE